MALWACNAQSLETIRLFSSRLLRGKDPLNLRPRGARELRVLRVVDGDDRQHERLQDHVLHQPPPQHARLLESRLKQHDMLYLL